jgi:chemotaxis protein histidine kinase CheA
VSDQSFEQMQAEFIADVSERIDGLSQKLAGLDPAAPFPRPLVDEVFRAAHSLRGTAGMFGMMKVSALAGSFENLLEAVRAGKVEVAGEVVGTLVEVLDELSAMLRRGGDEAEQSGRQEGDAAGLDIKILRILAGQRADQRDGLAEPGVVSSSASAAQPAALSVRVDIAVLDSIMNTVSELFSTKMALAGVARRLPHTGEARRLGDDLLKLSMLLNKRLINLQASVMEARLVPVSTLFGRYNAEVRRLARHSHKEVDLVFEGESTRADRAMLDRLYEPLLHVIRNAVDHGIEPGDERSRLGKPARGRLCLRAREEASHIVIEAEDDGRGVDIDCVKSVAAARGLSAADPDSALGLLFLPGFTTKRETSDISGRGVGLDAVKAQVEGMRGVVGLASEPGKGTRISLWLPLTLAVSRGMLVEQGGTPVVLPMGCVIEVLGLTDDLAEEIRRTGRFGYRGGVISAVEMAHLVKCPQTRRPRSVIVVGIGNRRRAIVVEAVCGEAEIVSRSLPRAMAAPAFITGATELHDGRPAIVVQPEGILRVEDDAFEGVSGGVGRVAEECPVDPREADGSLHLVVVRQGRRFLGLPIRFLKEVMPASHIMPLPVLGEQWEGLFFVKGVCHGLLRVPGVEGGKRPDQTTVVITAAPERCGVWAEETLGEARVARAELTAVDSVRRGELVGVSATFALEGRTIEVVDVGGALGSSLLARGAGAGTPNDDLPD